MAMHRSYAASHKGLRNILGQFSLLAGRTDYGSPADVQRLKALGDELFMLLTHHLHTENDHLLALLEQRVPGAAQHDLRDHEELEVIQQDVADRLARLDGTQTALEGHAFYLAFTAFQGRYLGHIHHEEVVTEELLLTHFTEAELIANSERIVQQVEFPVLLASLKYIVPAQSRAENQALFAQLKNAPPEAWNAVMDAVRPVMEPGELEVVVG